ncbi:MAG: enolase C-terminal domain-like protein [Bdellovibrionota bacterium]
MQDSLWFSRYFDSGAGALIKVELPGIGFGYADCHPWPELGDLSLERQLKLLAEGVMTPLTCCSMRFAQMDAEARSAGKSCFNDIKIPTSHFLVIDIKNLSGSLSGSLISRLSERGFKQIKVKTGRDLKHESMVIKQIHKKLLSRGIGLRLDFNSRISFKECICFIEELGEAISIVDFIEDPIPYDQEKWAELSKMSGIRLAADNWRDSSDGVPDAASVLVWKPAVIERNRAYDFFSRRNGKLVVTSYLDHPLGQVCAAYEAAVLAAAHPERMEICGLLSHLVYEQNEFSEQLEVSAARLIPPEGLGFGFDECLQRLNWKKL